MLHPSIIDDSRLIRLKWQRACRRCNRAVYPNDEAFWCPVSKTITCMTCGGHLPRAEMKTKRAQRMVRNPFWYIEWNDAIAFYYHLKAGNKLAREGSAKRASQDKILNSLRLYSQKATYRPEEADRLVIRINKLLRNMQVKETD